MNKEKREKIINIPSPFIGWKVSGRERNFLYDFRVIYNITVVRCVNISLFYLISDGHETHYVFYFS
jgi:hypothetical protein